MFGKRSKGIDLCLQDGRLNHKDIALIWKDYPTELHDWLLHLTEAYDLTFPLEGEPVNLVPCLLPEKAPEVNAVLSYTPFEKKKSILQCPGNDFMIQFCLMLMYLSCVSL